MTPTLRATWARGVVWAVVAVLLASCAPAAPAAPAGSPASRADWSPAPVESGGLRQVATASGTVLALHTASGDKEFLPGVNLGSTTPNHQPGELAISASDYRRWFAEMGRLGVRVVRIYTIHPPALYTELAAYNEAHPAAPLYLVQGVYLPDESYLDGGTLYDTVTDESFAQELADASSAVHGDLQRAPTPGRSSGEWTADVSPWVMAWIIGVEWEPLATARTDDQHFDAPLTEGRYFSNTAEASPTERWLARHMDALAGFEAAKGVSVPIAFVNWPTVDPLTHPREPSEYEDLVGVDANHVLATADWPGGTFASYHAYPYFPDFLRYEAALEDATWSGRSDAYAGYLRALRAHHAQMPVMITEVGVPSSLGSAHLGTNGRDQGNLTEREAMAIDADLLRLVRAQDMSGAFVFSWTDEWFKRTWNTMAHQVPADRRQLWHDPLTNEQYFGVVATDAGSVPGARRQVAGTGGAIDGVLLDADASYVFLDVALGGDGPPASVRVEVDAIPGPDAADYRVDVDLSERTAQVWVRAALDPVRLDLRAFEPPSDARDGWHPYRLLLNRPIVVDGATVPAEYQDVGALVEGVWDPESPDYDSLATWNVVEAAGGTTLRLRLPWPMVGLADPSSRIALGEGTPMETAAIGGLSFVISTPSESLVAPFTWEPWQGIGHTERLKAGAEALAEAFAELAP